MKNSLFSILFILFASASFSSCQAIFDDYEEQDCLVDKTPLTFIMQTRASSEISPVVNSARLFIFHEGVCLVNRYFGNSEFTVSKNTEDAGTYDVTVDEEFLLKPGEHYDIYAVLNESGYMSDLADGSGTLAGKLSSVRVGDLNYQAFLEVLDTKLSYDLSVADYEGEEPFVMLSYVRDYLFQPTAPGTAVTLRMTDQGAALRSMAIIHLDKITSAAPAGETATDLDLTARIFVQDVKLVNVPQGYYFTDHSDGTSSMTSDIQIGSVNADGYYTRTWPGTIHENVSGTIVRKEIVSDRFYRVLKNNGNGCWKLTEHNLVSLKYPSMNDDARYTANNGNIAQQIQTEINNFISSHTVPTEPVVDELQRSGAIISETPWNIVLNHTIYIPENISANSAQNQGTTGFLVKLALSDPKLDLSGIPIAFWESKISGWTGGNTFYSGDDILEWTGSSTSFLTRYALSCWADDPDKIDVAGSPNGYKFFVGNLHRNTSATLPSTQIPSTQDGVVLNWNIPAVGPRVVDVFVPINNKLDDNQDYSVRRNTRYNVTLHVMKSTYDNLTRSTADSYIPVTVKATINKVSENQ